MSLLRIIASSYRKGASIRSKKLPEAAGKAMRMIRVLHLVQDLKLGGLEKISTEIVAGLDPAGFSSEMWCLSAGGPLAEQLKARGRTVRIFGFRRYLMPWNIARLARLIKAGKFDIVHTHGYSSGIIGRLAARLVGVPVVIHHQHTTSASFMRPYQKVFERLTSLYLTDRIIACSEAVKRFLLKEAFGGERTISVVYNGVPASFAIPSKESDGLRDRLGLTGRMVIVSVASLTPHKGHRYLLEAFPAILTRFPDVHLILVGDGGEKGSLIQCASDLGIEHRVMFTGNAGDIRPYLELADIFVLPSLREAMGISIVEAMAKQLPVVASAVDGIPEVVVDNETGYLIPKADPDALAQKLIDLLSAPGKRKDFGTNGYRRFSSQFTFESTIKNIQDLYRESLNNGKH